MPSGDCRRHPETARDHMLHASGRVVERNRLDLRMAAKEIAALIERHRMRECRRTSPSFTPGAAITLCTMRNRKLALNKYVARHQQIGVFGHGSCQRVLNGNDGSGGRTVSTRSNTSTERAQGTTVQPRQHLLCSFVTEGPELALNGDFDCRNFHQGKVAGERSERKSIRQAFFRKPKPESFPEPVHPPHWNSSEETF